MTPSPMLLCLNMVSPQASEEKIWDLKAKKGGWLKVSKKTKQHGKRGRKSYPDEGHNTANTEKCGNAKYV